VQRTERFNFPCAAGLAVTPAAPAASSVRGESGANAGLKLPAGFCASVFAHRIGHARHLVVAENGIYVNTWSGTYYGNQSPPPR
jgi:hypothetical protein